MKNYITEIEQLKAAMENGTANRYTVMGTILDLAFEIGAERLESPDDFDRVFEARVAIRELTEKAVEYAWMQGIALQKQITEDNEKLVKEVIRKVWG